MITYTKEAQQSHSKRIAELIPIIATIPGNVLSDGDATDIIKYLVWLDQAMEAEHRSTRRSKKGL